MTSELSCPWCGVPADDGTSHTSDAERFCTSTSCGKPLFMKPSTPQPLARAAVAAQLSDAVRFDDLRADPSRRRPYVQGKEDPAAIVCPHCGEQNNQTDATCHRCLESLVPQPSQGNGATGDSANTGSECADTVGTRNSTVEEWILISLGTVVVALLVYLILVVVI